MRGKGKGSAKFTHVPHWFQQHPKWKALNPAAQAVYIALKRRFNGSNNGQIGASYKSLSQDMNARPETIGRHLSALIEAGFIHRTYTGHMDGAGNGKASEYRLSELPYRDPKTGKSMRASMDFKK